MPRNISDQLLNIQKELGNRIRHRRQELGKSKAYISRILEVSPQQINKYENGQDRMVIPRLIQLCQHLNLSPSELLEDITNENKIISKNKKDSLLKFRRIHIEINKNIEKITDHQVLKTINEIIKNLSLLQNEK